MPQQSLLRMVKRWRRYWPRGSFNEIPRGTRGFYVLYKNVRPKTGRVNRADVSYIGVSGLGSKGSVGRRLKRHDRKKRGWTHFSFFEVHDNVSGGEIRELEALLLQIFRHDSRVRLSNVQRGSSNFDALRRRDAWRDHLLIGRRRHGK